LEELHAFLVIVWIATNRRQPIGRKSDEPGDRQPARDIPDVGIEAAVLVDDKDDRQLLGRAAGPHQIPLMLPLPCGDETVADSVAMRLSCSGTCTAQA